MADGGHRQLARVITSLGDKNVAVLASFGERVGGQFRTPPAFGGRGAAGQRIDDDRDRHELAAESAEAAEIPDVADLCVFCALGGQLL